MTDREAEFAADVDVRDVAWLAGLLEGEGCFETHKNSPGLRLNMTDEDVVARAAGILGVPRPARSYLRDNRKPLWALSVHGAHAIEWMKVILPYMGGRRTAKIEEVIAAYVAHKANGGRKYTTRGMRVMAKCHPDRREHAKELCRNCYQKRNVERYKQDPVWVERTRQRKREWEARRRESTS